jgi:hypothetical protein
MDEPNRRHRQADRMAAAEYDRTFAGARTAGAVENVVADGKRFSTTLWRLSRDLDGVYRRGDCHAGAERVRALLLAIDRQR